MIAWIIVATLYALGALNMAVFAHDHNKLMTPRGIIVPAIWPVVAVIAIFEAIFNVELF